MPSRDRFTPRSRHLLPPLPGTGVPRRGLFVGRSSALLQLPDRGRLPEFSPALFTPGAVDALFRIQARQWNLYLVGNEEAVAHGRATDEHWQVFEKALLAHLAGQGVQVARNYACLDSANGKGRHKRDSVFEFPNTGVFYHAAQEDGVRLAESWLVSDDVNELAAGWRAGTRVASVRITGTACAGDLTVEPQRSAPNLTHLLHELAETDEYARR
ncbi:MAG: hypothetical protein U1F29_08595 [Planctomycetota bacterium]